MKKSLLLIFLTVIVSCSVKEVVDKPANDVPFSEYAVSLEEAESIASVFLSEDETFHATKADDISVKASFSIKDKSDSPLLHVINYEGGGFVLIAADTRLKPIQAYSPSGFFNDDVESYPLGLKIWLDSAEKTREKAVEAGEGADVETQLAWMKYDIDGFDIESIRTKSLTPIDIGDVIVEIDTLVGPLIQDSWHQNSPYNDSLNVSPHYYLNGFSAGLYKPVVGCKPLAIARLLRYNRTPMNYVWSSICDHEPLSPETASYISDVHYAVKSYAEIVGVIFNYNRLLNDAGQYYCATGVASNFPIDSFLSDCYGYSAAITEPYSYSNHLVIRREIIDYQAPCILSGRNQNYIGHTWLCDGYHYNFWPAYFGDEYLGGVESFFLHFSWGLHDNTNDGWFTYNNVPYYQYDMYITHRLSTVNHWVNE